MFDIVFTAVKNKIAIAANTRKLLDKVSKSQEHLDKLNNLQQAIRKTNMAIKRNTALRGRLFELYGDDLITEQEFRQMKDDYIAGAERLKSELAEAEREHAYLSSVFSEDNERIASFLKFKSRKALTSEIVAELIEKVIVQSADQVDIVWRYNDEYEAVCGMAKAGEQ